MKTKLPLTMAFLLTMVLFSNNAICYASDYSKPIIRLPKFEKFSPLKIEVFKLRRSPNVEYELDQEKEAFYLWKPLGFNAGTASQYGLIAYISSTENIGALPPGWEQVLTKHKYIFVAPQQAGNGNDFKRRSGLAIQAACQMLSKYQLDRRRLYVSGISGGARAACYAAFNQPDLFSGTIQDCGCEFYERVPAHYRTTDMDTAGKYYGASVEARGLDLSAIRTRIKFAVVTGSRDFRRGNILDIYYGGLQAQGFKCRLWDVPDMGHTDCDATTLEEILTWLAN